MRELLLIVLVVVISTLALCDDSDTKMFSEASVIDCLCCGSSGFGIGGIWDGSSGGEIQGAYLSLLLGGGKWNTGFIQNSSETKFFSIAETFIPKNFSSYMGFGAGPSAGIVNGKFNPEIIFTLSFGFRVWRIDTSFSVWYSQGFYGNSFDLFLSLNFLWFGYLDCGI